MKFTRQEVRYHEDVASLFAHIGGLDATDTVLLESADITTRSGCSRWRCCGRRYALLAPATA